MSDQKTASAPDSTAAVQDREGESRSAAIIRTLLTRRELMLTVLLAVLLIGMFAASAAGATNGPFNGVYLAGALITAVPLAVLALAEVVVILTGRGAFDLSVGSMVSLVGVGVAVMYVVWGLVRGVSCVA